MTWLLYVFARALQCGGQLIGGLERLEVGVKLVGVAVKLMGVGVKLVGVGVKLVGVGVKLVGFLSDCASHCRRRSIHPGAPPPPPPPPRPPGHPSLEGLQLHPVPRPSCPLCCRPCPLQRARRCHSVQPALSSPPPRRDQQNMFARGLHSSTVQLNVSTLRGSLGDSSDRMAQVELISGRVYTPDAPRVIQSS
jgi:hypothetical protein